VHGEGLIAGSLATYRSLASRIAAKTGCAVLTFNYGLAPEHPYPEGLNHCLQITNWMQANSPEGPNETQQLSMVGDSAGAGLILSCLLNRTAKLTRMPNAVVTLSALTDFAATGQSMQQNQHSDVLISKEAVVGCGLLYANGNTTAAPEISPLNAQISHLPPLQMQVSDSEVLVDDTRRFISKLKDNGLSAELKIWPQMVHVWHLFAPFLPEANQALQELARFINRHP
jgi:epsilon-lactone hydrolase